eukprot:scaffold600_cov193-Ochromonas_danica.AAC.15
MRTEKREKTYFTHPGPSISANTVSCVLEMHDRKAILLGTRSLGKVNMPWKEVTVSVLGQVVEEFLNKLLWSTLE